MIGKSKGRNEESTRWRKFGGLLFRFAKFFVHKAVGAFAIEGAFDKDFRELLGLAVVAGPSGAL